MASSPIRVGIIGLNASSSWAVNAHLPYFKDTNKYKIVALLNSSEGKAKQAIESHNLLKDIKAYGSPEAFAQDPNIDLIVCSTRVDTHYPILRPILSAENLCAKAVFCEWPLGKNLAEAEELLSLAEAKKLKTIIGLQGRQAPASHLVRKLLSEDKIGKVLSVTVTMAGYNLGAADLESIAYLSDLSIGGNLVTIHFSHTLDTITQTVGELKSYHVLLDTQRKVTKLRNKPLTYKPSGPNDEAVKIVGEQKRTSYDQIGLLGHLESGASFSFHLRGGGVFPNTPAIEWRVYGEKGEIRVTTPGMNLHYGGPGHRVEIHDHVSGEVEEIQILRDEWDEKELAAAARGPARVYEAFFAGKEKEYANWQDAVKRHKLVEEMYSRAKELDEEPARYML